MNEFFNDLYSHFVFRGTQKDSNKEKPSDTPRKQISQLTPKRDLKTYEKMYAYVYLYNLNNAKDL